MPIDMNVLGVFPGKMCWDRRKNHSSGQKKNRRPFFALLLTFGVGKGRSIYRYLIFLKF